MVMVGAKKKTYQQAYYLEHKERIMGRVQDYQKTPRGRYVAYKKQAKYKGRQFGISYETFVKYWDEDCYYCGLQVDGIGLDRVDSSRGYLDDNIVSCCGFCNSMKLDIEQARFIERCNLIANKHPIEV